MSNYIRIALKTVDPAKQLSKDIVKRALERNKVDLDENCRWQRPESWIKVSYDTLKHAVANGIVLDKDSHDESLEMAVAKTPAQKSVSRAKALLEQEGDDPDFKVPSLVPKPEPKPEDPEEENPEKPPSPLAPKPLPPPKPKIHEPPKPEEPKEKVPEIKPFKPTDPPKPTPKIIESEEGNEPVDPKDTEKIEELKATMEPEQKKEF